ncbi:MAG: glycine cleavage system protein H [Verrucomicrobia bacterium TMED44]|nr:MAG: glycine cleavage system protein H [Verrucomicrobia bacterium TMED44]|tara:strand:- start:251 stop:637 length:387 start_codon:yes stop_codon:yes gene_type:complete
MSEIPENLFYTKEHEWLKNEADMHCVVGITDHAQDSLGDVTFVELPEEGTSFGKGDVFGVVESVKAASDLYMPLGGEIIEVNEGLVDSPELLNSDPYAKGWLVKIKASESVTESDLLSPGGYKEEIGK